MSYGVVQERDWNALADEEFRALVRADFEAHYPQSLRYAPRRLRWHEIREWYLRMAHKGWIAPNCQNPIPQDLIESSPAQPVRRPSQQKSGGMSQTQIILLVVIGLIECCVIAAGSYVLFFLS